MNTVYLTGGDVVTVDDQNKSKILGSTTEYIQVTDTDGKHHVLFRAHIVRIA